MEPQPNVIEPHLRHIKQRRRVPAWRPEDYEKLQGHNDIRILILCPGTGSDICCSLRRISLDDSDIDFEALSYIWGRETATVAPPWARHSIYLKGRRFNVNINLFTILMRLRYQDQQRELWVDAVCINQTDLKERDQQVKLMRHVYQKAKQVIVDLNSIDNPCDKIGAITGRFGEATAAAQTRNPLHRLISWFRYHGASNGRANVAAAFICRTWQQKDVEEWLKSTLGKEEFFEDWCSVIALFAKPYWTRIWVIQEIGLARKLTVYCGNRSFDWQAICIIHRVWKEFMGSTATKINPGLVNWGARVQSYSVHVLRRVKFKLCPNVGDWRLQLINNLRLGGDIGPWDIDQNIRARRLNSYLPLLDLLASYYSSFSSNPRDKIYGLIGLADDCVTKEYDVDYSATEARTLEYVVRYMLRSSARLDVICYASFHKGLPSWVPWWGPITVFTFGIFPSLVLGLPMSSKFWLRKPLRYGQTRTNSFAPLRRRDLYHFFRRLTVEKDFAAARDSEAEARIEESAERTSILIAKGCVVDEVAEFLNMPKKRSRRNKGGSEEKPRKLALEFAGYADLLNSSSAWLKIKTYVWLSDKIKRMLARFLRIESPLTGETKIKSFLQTITYGRTHSGEVAGESWWDPFQILIRNGRKPSTPISDDLTDSELQQSRQYVLGFLDRVYEVLKAPVGEICFTDRKVYVTKGGLIGLGEAHSKKGDLVCVLYGCFRPILVKRRDTSQSWHEADTVEGASHGCTYIHSYMDGRAIDEMESGERRSCAIRLH